MDHALFLDRVRGIAQRGLNYARDPYDIARYEELLSLAGEGYEQGFGVPADEVEARFRREVGYITPKVGVDGAVFDDDGRVLFIRRPDSGAWALPGGWAELGEAPDTSVARELLEETTLTVTVGDVVAVSSRLPGPENGPHTSVHVLYHCTVTGGSPRPTAEATEVAYRHPAEVSDWHGDHGLWAARAVAWHRARPGRALP